MAYWKYLKYLILHKWYVGIECFKQGLYWAAIFHDFSKFRPSEFHAYAMFFCRKGQPEQTGDTIEDGDNPELRSRMRKAQLLHIHRNKHHWNYWLIVCRGGKILGFDMPDKYTTEMVCDWEGACKALRGKSARSIDWYKRVKDNLILSDYTRRQVERVLFERK